MPVAISNAKGIYNHVPYEKGNISVSHVIVGAKSGVSMKYRVGMQQFSHL